MDISGAYFCATADPERPTYVKLPAEHGESGPDKYALLLKHMYGTRQRQMGGTVSMLGYSPEILASV